MSDSCGGVYNGDGLDLSVLYAHRREGGRVSDFTGGEHISNEELLGLDVEMLVFVAVQSQITMRNVERIRAWVIAEGANASVTPDVEDRLAERGVLIIFDVLANAGGVIVSYFEWVQDLQAFFWESGEVNSRLE